VQPNTLRHYFGDREGVLTALMAFSGEEGKFYLDQVRPDPEGLLPGLRRLLGWLAAGWTPDGLGGLHAASLAEGMGDAKVGPAYVERVLEPTLQAYERVLAAQTTLSPEQRRVAVLGLLSPILLALLHQHELGGARCRPLDWPAFVEEHLAAWARGWGLDGGRPAPADRAS
jgi:AcrR family transcriptional regulator